MPDDSGKDRLCPSARCEPGALLIGRARPDGSIGHLPKSLEVDQDFVDLANADGLAETRFRFASKCVENRCKQWSGNQCGVVERITKALQDTPVINLPRCSIRKDCRWFAQRKEAACQSCSLVITDDKVSSRAYAKHLASQ